MTVLIYRACNWVDGQVCFLVLLSGSGGNILLELVDNNVVEYIVLFIIVVRFDECR